MKPRGKFSRARFLKRILITFLCIYALLCGALYFFQEKLLFHPRTLTRLQADSIYAMHDHSIVDTISCSMRDGNIDRGWLIKSADSAARRPLVIYFGGNAEEVSKLIGAATELKGFHLALINYRGYGRSEGGPSEEKMFSDAIEIYDQLSNRADVDEKNIFVIGRSIGTGVAVHLVKNRNTSGCVLVTPYDCMSGLAQEKYPFFPVKWLIKHPFNSIENADKIKTPVLCYVASRDEIIPPWHAYSLMLRWGGEKRIRVYENADHNSVVKESSYWKGISDFFIAQLR